MGGSLMHPFLTSSLSPSHFVPFSFVSFMGGVPLAPLPPSLLVFSFCSPPYQGGAFLPLEHMWDFTGSYYKERGKEKNIYLESLAPGHVSR